MPKRPHSPSLTDSTGESQSEIKPTIVKKEKRSKQDDEGGKKGTKTAWSAEEDAILVSMLEGIIKSHLWAVVKADGRLVHRTSYGVQYHAKMFLKQYGGKKSS